MSLQKPHLSTLVNEQKSQIESGITCKDLIHKVRLFILEASILFNKAFEAANDKPLNPHSICEQINNLDSLKVLPESLQTEIRQIRMELLEAILTKPVTLDFLPDKNTAQAIVTAAYEAEDQDNTQIALQLFTEANKIDPNNSESLCGMARNYDRLNQPKPKLTKIPTSKPSTRNSRKQIRLGQ